MILDPFKSDGFSLTSLTAALEALPYTPTILEESGLFEIGGITTLDATIESDGKTVGLVAVQPRNAPPQVVLSDKRSIRTFRVPHLPERSTIMADEVLGVRAFGNETQAQAIETIRDMRLAKMKSQIEYTIENHRLAAVMGSYYDAAGNLTSLFTEFGVTQQTLDFALSTSTTDVLTKTMDMVEKFESALDGLAYTGAIGLCGAGAWKKLIAHKSLKESLQNWNAAVQLRRDPRTPINFGGIDFMRYRGTSAVKIPDDEIYIVPTGVNQLFITRYAPANYIDASGSVGRPFYGKIEPMEMGKGVILEAQSNPLNICTRPSAIIKVTAN